MDGDYISLQLKVIKSTYLKCVHVAQSHYSVREGNMQEQHKKCLQFITNELIITDYQMLANP
jgi:hypothetical protein